MFLQLLKSIYNLFCGSTEQKPSQPTHQPPSKPTHQPPFKPAPQHPSHGPVIVQPQGKPPKHQDWNQINQQNESYVGLRSKASSHGDQMARCFQESKEAYSRGDGARAKQLSNEGKEHKRKMEELNQQASAWIYIENNKDSKPDEIDLHGLYVKEAITYADKAIDDAKRRGDRHVKFIVGKGMHSQGGVAKIKPAIEELMSKHRLVAIPDPNNAGVLIIELNGTKSRGGMGADEISKKIEQEDGCRIM